MQPTGILSREHRVIEVVLACIEQIARRAMKDKKLDQKSAEQAIDFIRTFADKRHHGKEETHLFAAMVNRGMPRESGPIGQMLQEHEQGRAYVRSMAESLSAAAAGDAGALKTFSSSANGFVQLLRNHIRKEDGVLFRMADRMLNDDVQRQLLVAFANAESECMEGGTDEKYLRIAETLADKFGVSKGGIFIEAASRESD